MSDAPAPADQSAEDTSNMPADQQATGADANAQDPTMAADPNAAAGMDPSMAGDAGIDPNTAMPDDAGEEMPEEPEAEDNTENNGDTSEIDDLWGKLDTEDKATAIKYVKSMIDDSEEDEEEGAPEDTEADAQAQPQPMMERVIFTKRQFRKLNENH